MSRITPPMLIEMMPLACRWAEAQEAIITREGVPLTAGELRDAQKIGVSEPGRIRLWAIDKIPLPDDPTLRLAAEQTGLISPFTIGLTLRYGIFIRADHWGERRLVIHEMAHTAQYERMGGFEQFLTAYLGECLNIGYPNGPLELEARNAEQWIISGHPMGS